MIKRYQSVLNFINALLDGVILYSSYFAASWIRFGVLNAEMDMATVWSAPYANVFLMYSLLAISVFFVRGVYTSVRKKRLREEAAQIIWLNLFSIIIFTSFRYFTKSGVFSRLTYLLFYCISTILLIAKRTIIKNLLYRIRTNGRNLKHVIVVGNGHLAKQYIESVNNNPEFGYHVEGYVSKHPKKSLGKNLGSYEDLSVILDKYLIDELVIALEPHETEFMKYVIDSSEKSGVKVSIIPFYNDYLPVHPIIEEIDEVKLFSIHTTPFDNPVNAFIKRFLDIVFSLILILLTSPIMLMAAVGTKLTAGPGPIIFKQKRIGKNRTPFTMYKFRSMRTNNEENVSWSHNVDKRKTKFGSFIRKFSIDELPQFFNVLKGDMSLIGPRPEIPHFVDRFKEEIPMYMIRHIVRPGITGWAQINGYRGDTSIKKRIEFDIWYIEHWSIMLDLQIVFRTIFGGMINTEKIGRQNDDH